MVSSMLNNKVLFIVEGDSDEVKFLKKLYKTCYAQQEFEIYSYKTNIHILAQVLYNDYPDFDEDEVDIKLVLRSLEDDSRKRDILNQKYRDVFLIFDFEPQHDHPHFDTVRRMLAFFSDSTNQGKLYINYPMMQSFKHLTSLPDDCFKDRLVTQDQWENYKELVGDESNFTDLTQYTYITFVSLAVHHLKKAYYIVSNKYEFPAAWICNPWPSLELFDKQHQHYQLFRKLYVVNTCIFLLFEFSPLQFFHQITTNKDKFYI